MEPTESRQFTREDIEKAAREGRLDAVMWQLHSVSEEELRNAQGDEEIVELLHQKMRPRTRTSE
jgi:hypothetical protein